MLAQQWLRVVGLLDLPLLHELHLLQTNRLTMTLCVDKTLPLLPVSALTLPQPLQRLCGSGLLGL